VYDDDRDLDEWITQRKAKQDKGSFVAALGVFILPFLLIILNYSMDLKLPFFPHIELPAEEVATTPPPPPPPAEAMKEGGKAGPVELRLWNFLRTNGLSREQAAGVMGNVQAESGFRPNVEEYGSRIGYGICQWSFGRRIALRNAARDQKKPMSDLDLQLKFLYDELHARKADRPEYRRFGNEWNVLKNMPTVEDALVAFHHEFELSHLMKKRNPRDAVIKARGAFAWNFFNNPRAYP
jgi:hypothetical protein